MTISSLEVQVPTFCVVKTAPTPIFTVQAMVMIALVIFQTFLSLVKSTYRTINLRILSMQLDLVLKVMTLCCVSQVKETASLLKMH